MNREIKFRIYDTVYKEMFYPKSGYAPSNYFALGRDLEPSRMSYPHHLMQYTGKKDKNGKEIYEGDVVIWNDVGGETEFNSKDGWIRKAIVKIDPSLNFELTKDTPSGTAGHKFHFGNFIYSNTEKHLKVIGNIYTNPDLLQ